MIVCSLRFLCLFLIFAANNLKTFNRMKKSLLVLLSFAALSAYAQPKIVAHRGFYKTAGSEENTLSSLANAQKLGVYGVEFDVNMTSDGELIVFHGPKITDELDAQKSSYKEISKVTLKNGHRIPTLRQWLEQGRKDPNTKLILEMKKHATPAIETEVAEKIVALCRETGTMEQMEFISFSRHACREFVRLAPENCVVYVSSNLWTSVDADAARKEGFGGLSYNLNVFMNRPELVSRSNELGIATTLWMVENEEVADWAVKHGITYISTDFPDRMKKYLERKR